MKSGNVNKGRYVFITLSNLSDWGFFRRRNEAFLWELSKRDSVESVLHIEHATVRGLLQDVRQWLVTHDNNLRCVYKAHVKKCLSTRPIQVDGAVKYHIFSIVVLYGGRFPFLRKMSDLLVKLQYASINRNYCPGHRKVLIAYPPACYLSGATKEITHDILLADLVDDVLERTIDVSKKQKSIRCYTDLLPRCNWIFSTSRGMNEKYRAYASQNIEYLPNGVDVDSYSLEKGPIGKNSENGRKIAGYVGNFNETIDEELLEHAIASCPHVDFAMIGHTKSAKYADMIANLCKTYNNIHYLGRCSYLDVPAYMNSFDVLISFKKADFTTVGNDSMKIYEYLATGKPVVTTPVSPAGQFSDLLYIASDKRQYVEYLKKALEEDAPALREKRKRAAASNSWSQRVDVILNKVMLIDGSTRGTHE